MTTKTTTMMTTATTELETTTSPPLARPSNFRVCCKTECSVVNPLAKQARRNKCGKPAQTT